VAVSQPITDDFHSSAEGIAGLFFDTHDECRIGRHIALLPLAREAGAFMGLSVGAASLAGGHQCGYGTGHFSLVLTYFFGLPKFLSTLGFFNPLERPDTASADA